MTESASPTPSRVHVGPSCLAGARTAHEQARKDFIAKVSSEGQKALIAVLMDLTTPARTQEAE